jgi:hypothetical protein
MFGKKTVFFLISALMLTLASGSMPLTAFAGPSGMVIVSLDNGSPSGTVYDCETNVMNFNIQATLDTVYIEAMTFEIITTDNASNDWYNFDEKNPIVDADTWKVIDDQKEEYDGTWTLFAEDGSTLGQSEDLGFARIVFDNAIEIDNGEQALFAQFVDLTEGSGNNFQLSLLEEGGAPFRSYLRSLGEFKWIGGSFDPVGLPLDGNVLNID